MKKEEQGKILLYKKEDGTTVVDIKFDWETIWLNQKQMANLFDVDRTVITRHINNIIKKWEIAEKSNVQKMHFSHSDKPIKIYNLDFVLAVWYRVNTKNGIKFRKWSTKILKEYLIKWYVLNQKRLNEIELDDFEKAINLIKKNIKNNSLEQKEIKGMLSLITEYAHSWIILQKYDEGSLSLKNLNYTKTKHLEYEYAMNSIEEMKKDLLPKGEVSEMFGIERNTWLKDILVQIYQSFDWKELYPSIEEKASALIYFIIKNHPFVDGNKKIGAFLLLVFLAYNNYLYFKNWKKELTMTH